MNKAEKYSYRVKAIKYGENDYEYTAIFDQFPQIAGDGNTQEEAIKEAIESLSAYIKYCEKHNVPLPEPEKEKWLDDFSGKITVRMPKSLHRDLYEYSDRDGASMNYIIIDAIRTYLNEKSLKLATDEALNSIKKYTLNQTYLITFGNNVYVSKSENETASSNLNVFKPQLA